MKPTVVTLLTDFGARDYFAGAMKGVILSINPQATIVDICHEIPPQDIHAGAFNLLACYRDFPAGTIHVAVVDPGVGSDRRAILVECAGQFFIGPDNGLFSWVAEREGNFTARQITNEKFFRKPTSSTFHGRDVFAAVAGALSTGVPPEAFGPLISKVVMLEGLEPRPAEDGLAGSVIHIDHFGNCITNFTAQYINDQQVQAGEKLIINGQAIISFRKFFSDGRSGDKDLFMLLGSAGFIEIAAENSSAALILSAKRGDRVLLSDDDHT